MIKTTYGEIADNALDILFDIPFREIDLIHKIEGLAHEVYDKRKTYKNVQMKLGNALGLKESEKISIETNPDAFSKFIELSEKEVELNVDVLTVTEEELTKTGVILSAKKRIFLSKFIVIGNTVKKEEKDASNKKNTK